MMVMVVAVIVVVVVGMVMVAVMWELVMAVVLISMTKKVLKNIRLFFCGSFDRISEPRFGSFVLHVLVGFCWD